MAIKASVNRANTAAIAARLASKKTIQAQSVAVGSAGRIEDLTDIDLDDIADGKTLAYNAASGKWKAITPEAGRVTANALDDVNTDLLAQGALLVWDSDTEKWVAKKDIEDGTSLNGGQY
jgi:hypothetical protein